MRPRRETLRWLLVSVLLLVAVWALYEIFKRLAEYGPTAEAKQLLLPAMTFALVVLALGLVGVLVRNLVKLILERKSGLLGSRLRTKLVFFLLALVLLPATVLFSGSAQVIKQTVEAILLTPMEDLTRQSREIVDELNAYFKGRSLRRAEVIAAEIRGAALLDDEQPAALSALLQQWRRQGELDLVWVSRGGDVIAEAVTSGGTGTATEEDLRTLVGALVREVAADGRPGRRIDYLGQGLLAHAAVPVEAGAIGADERHVVAVGLLVPTRVSYNLEELDVASKAYRQFRAKRRELVRFYLTLIGLVFLVTLFIATWIGFYITRRITEPVRELAAAAREISAGNLAVRVGAEVGDEMGLAVEAFNEMAGELQENREVITRSTADLRRSNRALDERRRYIETLMASLSTGVVSLDPAGHVSTTNPPVEEILGIRLEPGDDARLRFVEAGLDPLAELVDRDLELKPEGIRRDLRLPGARGALAVSVQISPLHGAAGEDLGTLFMVEDLTELLQAQKAAAWREIARRIAHEIKNPLTPIQLAAQRLRKKFSEGAQDLDTVLPEATASIEREVGALKRLVDEFSKFARMPEVAPREVEFGKLIDSVLALYKGLEDVEWDVRVPPDLGPVKLDPEQMRRVLINLIDNAVSAMDGKGRLSISAERHAGEGLLRVEVADSGPGIPPGDRDKMFSPYFSTKKRGTGLGLAIVHRVVTDHHGKIRVEDNRPGGANFVIEIPA
ncbi:MAG: HAMP domain-containing protein [bacterium]|nr:HAMP domain-containing protein [bacterium]